MRLGRPSNAHRMLLFREAQRILRVSTWREYLARVKLPMPDAKLTDCTFGSAMEVPYRGLELGLGLGRGLGLGLRLGLGLGLGLRLGLFRFEISTF